MIDSTYTHLSAADIAMAVRENRLSASEVVRACFARIDKINPALNAFTALRRNEALKEAADLDSSPMRASAPLAGVPIVIKEEFDIAGLPTTLGGSANPHPATSDSPAVAKLRQAGAIVVGKTTMPEFGQFPDTASLRYGITRNPWNPHYSPGGSSGGTAAAIASGMVPVGLGADGGGSIRLPASCCSIIGLKPGVGLFTPEGASWHKLIVHGVLSRNAADSALVYDLLEGNTRYRDACSPPQQKLRIAWSERPAVPTRVDQEVLRTLRSFASMIARNSHSVYRSKARWPFITDSFLLRFLAGMHEESATVQEPSRLERRTLTTASLGKLLPKQSVQWALRRAKSIAQTIDERFLNDADILLLPTIPCLPKHAGWSARRGTLISLAQSASVIANTAIFNVTGHPAISVPGGFSREGIPIGIQMVAKAGEEASLLAFAASLDLPAKPAPL